MKLFALLVVALVACGGDESSTQKPAATPAKPGTPAPARAGGAGSGSGSGKALPVMTHAEDRVTCPPPRSGSQKCDPNAVKPPSLDGAPVKHKPEDLWCDEGQVCQNTTEGYLCGSCPERFTIRHVFKDRDFASETNRDPFQPFIIKIPGTGSGSNAATVDPTSRCVRAAQMRVSNYGYLDLKLVGIVSQGTQRKVLMMDPGQYGHIIKRGDCVGKEKAWVKDIGENYICFELTTDQAAAARLPEGQCMELHTKQLSVTELPSDSESTQAKEPAPAPLPVVRSRAPDPPPEPEPAPPTTTPTKP